MYVVLHLCSSGPLDVIQLTHPALKIAGAKSKILALQLHTVKCREGALWRKAVTKHTHRQTDYFHDEL